jgi:hypothetical protein
MRSPLRVTKATLKCSKKGGEMDRDPDCGIDVDERRAKWRKEFR